MSCPDCDRDNRIFRLVVERLDKAALAHGYELWWRRFPPQIEVLAIPVAASFGSADALIDAFKELGQRLPGHPSSRARRERDMRTARLDRNPEAGHRSYRLRTVPPIELVFIDRLQEQGAGT